MLSKTTKQGDQWHLKNSQHLQDMLLYQAWQLLLMTKQLRTFV